MNERKLENYQAVAISVTVMLAHIILNLPNHLITATGPSTVLSLVYVFGIILFVCWIVTKFFKLFPNSDLIDVCEYAGGKAIRNIYIVMLLIYLITIAAFVIRIFAESLVLIYFPNMDIEIIILIFITITALMNFLGFKSIARTSVIILPIILFALIVVFISSASAFIPERALPILGYGFSDTFLKGLGNIFAFSSALVIPMLAPFINDGNRMRKVGFISLIIYGLCLITATISLLFLIPSVNDINSTLSIYIIAKRVSLGDFVQSIDALFIPIWIMSIFTYLSIIMHFLLASFKRIVAVKHETSMIYVFSAILFVVCMLPRTSSDISFFESTVYKYASLIFVFLVSFSILICGYIKKKHDLKKGANVLEETN